MVGKTSRSFVEEGFDVYFERIKNYTEIKTVVISDIQKKKNLSIEEIKQKEAVEILKKIPEKSFTILLDENGKSLSSVEFSKFIENKINTNVKELVFIIGGAYGVSDKIRQASNYVLSMSAMTFTHQFIRLLLAEQIYRAFSIMKNEPYHNE